MEEPTDVTNQITNRLHSVGQPPLSATAGLEESSSEAALRSLAISLAGDLQQFGLHVGSAGALEVLRRQKNREAALQWFLEREKTLKDLGYRSGLSLQHVLFRYLQARGNFDRTEVLLLQDRDGILRLKKQVVGVGALSEEDLLWTLRTQGSMQNAEQYLQENQGQIRSMARYFGLDQEQVFWMVRRMTEGRTAFREASRRLREMAAQIYVLRKEMTEAHGLNLDRRTLFWAFQMNGDLIRAKKWLLQIQPVVLSLMKQMRISQEEALKLYWRIEQTALQLKGEGIHLSTGDLLYLLKQARNLEQAVAQAKRLQPQIQALATKYQVPEPAVWYAYRQDQGRNVELLLRDVIERAEQLALRPRGDPAEERMTFHDALWLIVNHTDRGTPLAVGRWPAIWDYVRRLGRHFLWTGKGRLAAAAALGWHRRSRTTAETGRRISWEYPAASRLAKKHQATLQDVLWAHELATGGSPRSLWDKEEARAAEKMLVAKQKEADRLVKKYGTTRSQVLEILKRTSTPQRAAKILAQRSAPAKRLTAMRIFAAGLEEVDVDKQAREIGQWLTKLLGREVGIRQLRSDVQEAQAVGKKVLIRFDPSLIQGENEGAKKQNLWDVVGNLAASIGLPADSQQIELDLTTPRAGLLLDLREYAQEVDIYRKEGSIPRYPLSPAAVLAISAKALGEALRTSERKVILQVDPEWYMGVNRWDYPNVVVTLQALIAAA